MKYNHTHISGSDLDMYKTLIELYENIKKDG